MTEDEPFIARIVADPQDNLPRQVYADYLDETGRPERAEFIRVQCELARMEAAGRAGNPANPVRNVMPAPNVFVPIILADLHEYTALHRREKELLQGCQREWLAGTPLAIPVPREPIRGIEYWLTDFDSTWRRGFVAGIKCGWSACRDHLDAIRKEQPIEKVVLSSSPVIDYIRQGPVDGKLMTQFRFQSDRGGPVVTDTIPPLHGEVPDGRLLLSLRWPKTADLGAIAFELPPEPPPNVWRTMHETVNRVYTNLMTQRVRMADLIRDRDRIEAAVRGEMPVGERVLWLDRGGRVDVPPMVQCEGCRAEVLLSDLWPHLNGLVDGLDRVARGRCERCRITFLAEFHPPVPEVPNGRQR